MSRFQFVADNSATFEVKRLCELVEIERSSYYAWKAGAAARAQRAAADARLLGRIRAVHDADNTVGAPRVTAELNDGKPAGERVNHKRVARVMRGAGIAGYVKKRRVRTTIPSRPIKGPRPAEARLHRCGTWASLCGRHHLPADRRRQQLVPGHRDRLLQPPTRRLGDRRSHAHQPRRRCPHRGCRNPWQPDRGDLPQRPRLGLHLEGLRPAVQAPGVTQSMGAVGTSADNALAESFNATLKREVLQDAACWPDDLTCRRQLFTWLTRYNTKRRHSWCRYQSPIAYETRYTTTLPTAA